MKNGWLKTIVGDGFTDEMDAKVAEYLGQNFTTKADFNLVNDEVKSLRGQITDRDSQLAALKAIDPAKLQDEITRLTTANTAAQDLAAKQIAELKLNYAIDTQLLQAGAVNTKAVKALLDVGKLSLDGENVIGLKDQVDGLRKTEAWAFGASQQAQGLRTHHTGGKAPTGMNNLQNPASNVDEGDAFMNSFLRQTVTSPAALGMATE